MSDEKSRGIRPPRAGAVKLSGSASVTERKEGKSVERVIGTLEEEWEFDYPDEQPTHLTASVGIAIHVGRSTQFAREKIEVGVWCTLPSAPDKSAMTQQLGLAKRFAAHEAQEAMNELGSRFFPEQWSTFGDD